MPGQIMQTYSADELTLEDVKVMCLDKSSCLSDDFPLLNSNQTSQKADWSQLGLVFTEMGRWMGTKGGLQRRELPACN